VIRWTDERFAKNGLATPRLDAEILLAHALGMDRVGLYTHFDQPLHPDELARFRELIQRRLKREPVAYILGRREFWSLDLTVTPHVLIPRPETELLVSEGLGALAAGSIPKEACRILEIGTGCGAIAIALAKEITSASLLATDTSGRALSVAKENAQAHGVRDRLEFRQGDLFSPLADGETFHLIVTNPPYIPTDRISALEPEIRDYEPRVALDGGPDGLDFYRRALPQVHRFLEPEGWFLAEIGAGQDKGVSRIALPNGRLDSFAFAEDLAGMKRVFKARKK
jgi:release factor glutamine methyltransferase